MSSKLANEKQINQDCKDIGLNTECPLKLHQMRQSALNIIIILTKLALEVGS